jgi:hypothetical protein
MVLARVFAWLDRWLGTGPAGQESGFLSGPAPAPHPVRRAVREPLPHASLLSVDGGGQFLLCGAERLTLGHLRAGHADLAFLADVGALHATLVRADSLQAGPGWRIEPCGGERVTVADEPGVPARLGENLQFSLELPDPASASAVLELQRGAECAGARRIVLLAPGPGGRVRIGSSRSHHVRVPGLDFEVVLEWRGRELVLTSELPLEGAFTGERGRIAFPPSARLAFTCGKPRGSRPPFGLCFEPVFRERGPVPAAGGS